MVNTWMDNSAWKWGLCVVGNTGQTLIKNPVGLPGWGDQVKTIGQLVLYASEKNYLLNRKNIIY